MPYKHLRSELWLTHITLAVTFILTLAALTPLATLFFRSANNGNVWNAAELLLFIVLVLVLIYGSVVYQLTRIGHIMRLHDHRPVPDEEVERKLWSLPAPPVAVLVPSYKEEQRTVEQTLLSAALQDYPDRRVVLLLDDPPNPNTVDDRLKLEGAKRTVEALQASLNRLALPFEQAKEAFRARVRCEGFKAEQETSRLAELYVQAAVGLEERAGGYNPMAMDHTDRFFVEKVLLAPARAHRERAEELRAAQICKREQAAFEYGRLASLFRVEVSVFERKRYLNLSHEANKAMNLNSYIGLLGKSFSEIATAQGLFLHEVDAIGSEVSFTIPDAEYVVTLDADSLLMPGYVKKLVHHMEQAENRLVAVAQTPYTAVPGAPGWLERVAGSTTDIQYLVHQGSAFFSAAYWVGANAVLRKSALDHICSETEERGHRIHRYIQDRTVIEDTESTLDLIERSWEIHNYPERLAYSATPPDFGAVLVQRRRWANGGLIILPKLLRHLFRAPSPRQAVEGFIRVHYLFSLAGVNLALLLVFVYPFDKAVSNMWLPLTAAPYFFLYARDLSLTGRRFWDVLSVYAFNLMLIPIQLGGVIQSLRQALTGRKTSFKRTPKVTDRTSAPKRYVVAELGLLAALSVGSLFDALSSNWSQAALGLVNASFFLFVITAFIGWRACFDDLFGRQVSHKAQGGQNEVQMSRRLEKVVQER